MAFTVLFPLPHVLFYYSTKLKSDPPNNPTTHHSPFLIDHLNIYSMPVLHSAPFLPSTKTPMARFLHWYPVAALLVINLAFAITNILLKKIVTAGTDRLVFITYRQAISAVFLFPLAFVLERKNRPKLTLSVLCQLFLSAIIGASVTQYLFLLGIQYTSATFSCAFLNMVPVITFLMALAFRLETVNVKCSSGWAKVAGASVCLGGAIILTTYKGVPLFHFPQTGSASQSSREHHPKLDSRVEMVRWAIGSLALFAATLCWSSWFILQTYIGKKYPYQYSGTAVMTFFSAIQSAVLSLSVQRDLSVWAFKSMSDILIVLYAGMVASGLCFVGMSWCVKRRGPVFTAAFSPLIQIMSAIFEVPVLHEQLYLGSLIGSVTVIGGLYMLLWGKDRDTHKQLDDDAEHQTHQHPKQDHLQLSKLEQV